MIAQAVDDGVLLRSHYAIIIALSQYLLEQRVLSILSRLLCVSAQIDAATTPTINALVDWVDF